ncbi:MAG TPA: HYR domain-containing protein [Planctomycetota bacterium]
MRAILEGFVLGPDGSPAENAVVVSSAGGRAVSDVAGNYRLEVEVPVEATSVQVTAVGGASGNLVASASVALSGTTGPIPVDPLALSRGSSCSPLWLPTFGVRPGTNDAVEAVAAFDDGNGPALFVAGSFTIAGTTNVARIAKWDGSGWSAAVGQLYDGAVHALVVHDDGSGPALYAGGAFESALPPLFLVANRIARWNGSNWSSLGSGMNDTVYALASHDEGGTPVLYAGGEFTTAGGVSASRIARWDGSSWTALGSGMDDAVHALVSYDDGGGSALYAGGDFTTAGGVAVSRIAQWDGSSWSSLGSGLSGTVNALATHDDGGGTSLYAAGAFSTAGGVTARRVARWDGASWAALGDGVSSTVLALATYDDGGGTALYAAGAFSTAGGVTASRIAKWNGSSWAALGSGVTGGQVRALGVHDAGQGPVLFAGGTFQAAGGALALQIAAWNGSSWTTLGTGLNERVEALTVHDDGGGPVLYAGGEFTTAGGVATTRVGKWDGSSWTALGSGMNLSVEALTVHDDGGGAALYAGGSFTAAGGGVANRIARWDGSSWSSLGSGMNNVVHALAVYDDGGGPSLYAGGVFTTAGGVAAAGIAKWNGSSWSDVGGGVGGTSSWVFTLKVYDDGFGPALYAGGLFSTAGGMAASSIARWDGSSWTALGSGVSDGGFNGNFPRVNALAVHDDGGGPALFAGGDFNSAGGMAARKIAKWDGASWTALGSGMNAGSAGTVYALASHDAGAGPVLVAGGSFTSAGGVAVNRIGKWDGASWSALGSGLNSSVSALVVFDDGSGPALHVGGSFDRALDSEDSFLAKWGCDTIPPTLSCPPSVFAFERYGTTPGEVVHYTISVSDNVDPAPSAVCVPPSGSFFPLGTTVVTCTSTDTAGNQTSCEFPVTVAPKVRQR